ncbi:dynamin family GTPase [Klosneuvirus KNV1]|uniref:Dynamin family GTPase n=1 Tax=Klosneuvirus KNV1 TaxID=1977640 RepID=A0A1V0SLT0_9VIRU|nr:dynamin family GTPase [Klosneuvirus KNV1]
MENRLSINIPILGPVSAGKSTLVNTLFVDTYSDMKIKRTTMVPQVYHETDKIDQYYDVTKLREINRAINEDLIKKTENGTVLTQNDINEIEYFVPNVYDLVNLTKNVYLSIYDIPGLNDGRTKQLYFDYIRQNFYKFDIILFVVDINSSINTSDEMDILKLILEETKKNKTKYDITNYLLILVNKCDTMYLNDKGALQLEDEHQEMFEQVQKTITQYIKEINPELKHCIMPISCEDSYIYRMYKRNPDTNLDIKYLNKFGQNEYGKTQWNKMKDVDKKKKVKELIKTNYADNMKLCGFTDFKEKLNVLLNPTNQVGFLENHIKYELNLISGYNKYDIQIELSKFRDKYNNLMKIKKDFKKNTNDNAYEYYINTFNNYIKNYITYIKGFFNSTSFQITNLISSKNSLTIVSELCDTIKDKKMMSDVSEINTYILIKINDYYKNLLKDTSLKTFDMMNYFDELNKYKCTELHNIIIQTVAENSTILSLTNEQLIETIKIIIDKYNFDDSNTVQLVFNVLSNKYEKVYKTLINSSYLTINFAESYSLIEFWQKVYIDYSNKYVSYTIMLKIFSDKIYNYILRDKIVPDILWRSLHKNYNYDNKSIALEQLFVNIINKYSISQKLIDMSDEENNESNSNDSNEDDNDKESQQNILTKTIVKPEIKKRRNKNNITIV